MNQPFQIKVNEFEYTKEFQKLVRAFDNLTKHSTKDIKEILGEQARLFCIDLIFVTQPWGKNTKSKKAGEGAILKDIRKAYFTEADLYKMVQFKSAEQASAFYALMKSGSSKDLKRAQGILKSLELSINVEDFDGGSHHRSNRDGRGRVRQGVRPKYTNDKTALNKYIKQVQKRVGLAKGGWADAANDLAVNGRGIPAWVSRHTKTQQLGSATYSNRGPIQEVIIINRVRYIKNLIGKAQIIKALGTRARAIELLVKRVIQINANKEINKIL